MEVHHHSHKPKNWKEYITEFIMLFAAVTLGFFAENVREHQIINHRIEQNKIAIYKDLQADSVQITKVLAIEDTCIINFNRLNNILYLAKANKINQKQLIDSIKKMPRLIGVSITLYMNNSSFKNMQSSGLLSYLEEGALKSTLAKYYEVDFKSLEAANQFFDQVTIDFNNYFPLGSGKSFRKKHDNSKAYVLNDYEGFQNFFLSLEKAKNIIQSDDFFFEVQKYYNFIYYYRLNIYRAKVSNDALLKLLRTEIH